jgi:hypothetical protein
MVTLSSIDSAEHGSLNELVQETRALTMDRLLARLSQGVREGEIPEFINLRSLARFVQTVQNGMSILARDNVSTEELTEVARLAMLGWDEELRKGETGPGSARISLSPKRFDEGTHIY